MSSYNVDHSPRIQARTIGRVALVNRVYMQVRFPPYNEAILRKVFNVDGSVELFFDML